MRAWSLTLLCAGVVASILWVSHAHGQAAQSARVANHDFVGADRCQTCHAEAYDVWRRSPHARALAALSEKERKDPRCLSCHTTVPDDDNALLAGVQCESCHGGGKYYVAEYVMRDPELRKLVNFQRGDEKTCLRCHTESSPSLKAFSYAEKLEAIRHWKPAGSKP